MTHTRSAQLTLAAQLRLSRQPRDHCTPTGDARTAPGFRGRFGREHRRADLNLLGRLQQELGVAFLLISHELSLIRQLADRVLVMYLEAVMETADTEALFVTPQHPYTQALLSAVPLPDPATERARARIPLRGEVPSNLDIPAACRFHTRCFKAEPVCAEQEPPLDPVAGADHRASCWFAEP